MLKVLESPENFLGEVFRQGLGQSPEVLPPHDYPHRPHNQTEQNPAEREADAETEQRGNANVEERQSVQNGGARAWDQVDGNGDGDKKNQINGERGKTVLHIRPTQGNV